MPGLLRRESHSDQHACWTSFGRRGQSHGLTNLVPVRKQITLFAPHFFPTTLAVAQAQLAAALAALEAAGTQQEYQILAQTGGRKVQRGAYSELLKSVQYWEQKVAQLSRPRGGLRSWSAVPR